MFLVVCFLFLIGKPASGQLILADKIKATSVRINRNLFTINLLGGHLTILNQLLIFFKPMLINLCLQMLIAQSVS